MRQRIRRTPYQKLPRARSTRSVPRRATGTFASRNPFRSRVLAEARRHSMSTTTAIVLAVIVLIVLAAAAFLYFRDRRSKQLRSRFGPEYSRALEEAGDRQKAEAWLQRREKRVHSFDIRPLSAEDKARYLA